jgi:hypothetical protein
LSLWWSARAESKSLTGGCILLSQDRRLGGIGMDTKVPSGVFPFGTLAGEIRFHPAADPPFLRAC